MRTQDHHTASIREVEKRQRKRWKLPVLGVMEAMKVTLRTMLSKAATVHYPEERLELPPRTRSVIALLPENCTVCMLCAKECPCWCIYIEGHKVTKPGRRKPVNELDRFAIDFSLCMYCGICVEVCPFDALHWSPFFEYSSFTLEGLVHEAEVLAGWEDKVLPPPQLVDDADEKARTEADTANAKRTQGVAGVIREADKRDEYLRRQAGVEAPAAVSTALAEPATPAAVQEAPAEPAPAQAPAPPADHATAAGPKAEYGDLPAIDPLNLPEGLSPVERGRLKRLEALMRHGRPVPPDLIENLRPILDRMRG